MPEVSSSFAYGPAFETHAKKLKSGGISLRRIAKMMSISKGLVERLIAGRSNPYVVSRDEIKSLRDRWVRERCKNAYARLYRHDKTWLMKQTKRKRTV
jgi:transposase